ncbi:nuclease-related domain-containing protein [Nocardioides sp.]|uniref:nuclease-related domain-containing protein n=1 Tax=Nocardioides sp. TaxID=35761 RepID=UPI003519D5F6
MAGESAREQARRARAQADRWAQRALAWEKGAAGEALTATALAELDPTWTAWHDLHWPGRQRANLDHLVIGPGGIFVIDSKNWSGAVTVREGVLRQQGYRRDREVSGAGEAALAVARLLPRYADRVRGVVCVVRPDPIHAQVQDVVVCSAGSVAAVLRESPVVMGVDEVADAVLTLQARLRSTVEAARARPETVAAPLPGPTPVRRPGRPERRSGRRSAPPRRSRRPRRSGGVLAPLVLLAALVAYTDHLAEVAGSETEQRPTPSGPAAPGTGGTGRDGTDPGIGQRWRP